MKLRPRTSLNGDGVRAASRKGGGTPGRLGMGAAGPAFAVPMRGRRVHRMHRGLRAIRIFDNVDGGDKPDIHRGISRRSSARTSRLSSHEITLRFMELPSALYRLPSAAGLPRNFISV